MKVILIATLIVSAVAGIPDDPFSDEYIEYINKQDLTWKAGKNFDDSMTLEDAGYLLGVLPPSGKFRSLPVRSFRKSDGIVKIPVKFDARQHWTNCSSIKKIRDQSNCGSCWAFAAVEAMSDRICIHSEQKNQTSVSAQDLLTCCGEKCGEGCNGGYPAAAWEYWYTDGLVTGGDFHDTTVSQTYFLESCEHKHSVLGGKDCNAVNNTGTPQCTTECDNKNLTIETQKTFGSEPYALPESVEDIQIEIMTNGPVEASFDVFPSFLAYKNGE
ncbi:hypothetical protein JTB14_008960 [Gonioctena quinquepunctata]|nr:hypothetical protein JTB14_008960 [Gonioctena quinquepunctata]